MSEADPIAAGNRYLRHVRVHARQLEACLFAEAAQAPGGASAGPSKCPERSAEPVQGPFIDGPLDVRSSDLVGWGVLECAVDPAGPVEAGDDRQPAGHRRWSEPTQFVEPADEQLNVAGSLRAGRGRAGRTK